MKVNRLRGSRGEPKGGSDLGETHRTAIAEAWPTNWRQATDSEKNDVPGKSGVPKLGSTGTERSTTNCINIDVRRSAPIP